MGVARVINNLGIGRIEGTFLNDTTSAKDFKQSDLDSGLNAAELVGNNKVGMGTDGNPLFGCVVAVDEELSSSIPVNVAVSFTGVEEFIGAATVPAFNDKVAVDGAGKVKQDATADTQLAQIKSRGIVINVHDTTDIEILL